MNKLFYLLFISFLFTGCRSFNLTMTSPEQYRSLDSTRITITAKDSVLILRHSINNSGWKKELIPQIILPVQKVMNDTIIHSTGNITIAVPFKSIASIKCRGVWDEEVGFISEMEIEKYYEGGFRIGFPILGALIATPASTYLAKNIAPKNAFYDVVGGGLIVGFVGGILLGHFFDMEIRYNEAIDRIIQSRKGKNRDVSPHQI